MKLKTFKTLVSHSFQEWLIYNEGAILTFLTSFIFFAAELLAGFVYFGQTDLIFGWTEAEYYLLITTATLASSIYETFFISSHEYLTDYILDGELDYTLLRPVNSFVYHLFYRIDIPGLVNMIVNLGFLIYFIRPFKLSFIEVLVFIALLIIAVGYICVINQIVVTTAFWSENSTSLLGMPEYLVDFSSRPIDVYPKGIRFVLSYIVPILLAINGPLLYIKGRLSVFHAVFLVGFLVLLFYLAYKMWNKGLELYRSAN